MTVTYEYSKYDLNSREMKVDRTVNMGIDQFCRKVLRWCEDAKFETVEGEIVELTSSALAYDLTQRAKGEKVQILGNVPLGQRVKVYRR